MGKEQVVKESRIQKLIEQYHENPESVHIVPELIQYIQQKEAELDIAYGKLYDCEETIDKWQLTLQERADEIEKLNEKLEIYRHFFKEIFVHIGQQGLLDKDTLLKICVEKNIIL